jgi:hypothetical protein
MMQCTKLRGALRPAQQRQPAAAPPQASPARTPPWDAAHEASAAPAAPDTAQPLGRLQRLQQAALLRGQITAFKARAPARALRSPAPCAPAA